MHSFAHLTDTAANKPRQATPGVCLAAQRASLPGRGCAHRWTCEMSGLFGIVARWMSGKIAEEHYLSDFDDVFEIREAPCP
jgi:hypothetical protein